MAVHYYMSGRACSLVLMDFQLPGKMPLHLSIHHCIWKNIDFDSFWQMLSDVVYFSKRIACLFDFQILNFATVRSLGRIRNSFRFEVLRVIVTYSVRYASKRKESL